MVKTSRMTNRERKCVRELRAFGMSEAIRKPADFIDFRKVTGFKGTAWELVRKGRRPDVHEKLKRYKEHKKNV